MSEIRTADTPVKVVPTFGRKPPFFLLPFLPAEQTFPIFCLAVGTIIIAGGVGLSFKFGFFLFFWLSTIWVGLTGFRPWLFTNQFIPLPGHDYINGVSKFVNMETEPKLFAQKQRENRKMLKVRTPSGRIAAFRRFQADCQLHGIIEVELDNYQFAAFLLCDRANKWSASIPFLLEGLHTELYDKEVVGAVDSLVELFDSLLEGERITFYGGCRSHSQARSEQLDRDSEASNQRELPVNSLLMQAEKRRMQQLTERGLRQIWEQILFCGWHLEKGKHREADWLTNLVNDLVNGWANFVQTLMGTGKSHKQLLYAQLGEKIFKDGFMPWEMLLKQKGNLALKPTTGEFLWEWLWRRFNQGKAPSIPQLVKVYQDKNGTVVSQVISNTSRDILSVLLAGEEGKPRTPSVRDRKTVYCKGEYIAAMYLDGGSQQKGKPKTYGTLREQLKYMFRKLSDVRVQDTEFWVELEPANPAILEDDLIRTTKQSSSSNKYAAEKGRVMDVAATLRQEDALEAQRLLYEQRRPVYVGFTALIYRKDPTELDRACKRFAHLFGSVKLIRDVQVDWKRWLEVLPITTARQLTSTTEGIFDPRLIFPSSEVPGLLPITCPQDINKKPKGVEFLSDTKPIYLDFIGKNALNGLICAKKGGGKSVITFPVIRHSLVHGPFLGLDMSTGGDSTFKLVCDLYGERAAYISLPQTRYNPILMPDLRSLPPSKAEERLDIWKTETLTFLVALVMGSFKDDELEQRVEALMLKAFNLFLEDPRINERYYGAIASGYGSTAWYNQPTLHHFVPFCSAERLGLHFASELDKRALNHIETMLEARLNDPNIGRAIGFPSEVRTDADLTIFSLSGLNNPNNALVMALVAQIACTNLGLSHPKSLFGMDECSSILRTSPRFAQVVGKRFAVGRKFGQGTLLIGQDLESILQTETASQIITNLDVLLLGLMNDEGTKIFHQAMGVPLSLIRDNASHKFNIWKEEQISYWLLRYNGRYWRVSYPTSILELAMLANSPDERALRQKYVSPEPQLHEIIEFTKVYQSYLREAA